MRTDTATLVFATFLFLTPLAGGAGAVHAQLPADSRWETIESTHFRVTYEAGLEPLARRAVASAERAHAALSLLVADAPRGVIDIVVADHVDYSNGYATPFPSNRIVVFATPPVDFLPLQHMDDWIDLVVVHELAHIFHLDVTGTPGRLLRSVFGRVPLAWPVFPAVMTPGWSVEGLAVGIESMLTEAGRVHGSYHEMVVRTAVLAGVMDDIDRIGAVTPLWPGGMRAYVYGSLFMDYLTRRYGADATARIVRGTADALIPPMLWFGGVARGAFGVTFREAYEDWQRELESRYARLETDLRSAGLTAGQPLTDHGAYAMHPRYSPDGGAIAYGAHDWRSPPGVRVIDSATGAERWARRTNDIASIAWMPYGGILTSQLDFVDRFRVYSDLHVHGGGVAGRLTRGQRLKDPDLTRDGAQIVAVENEGGTNRLVIVDVVARTIIPLGDFDPDVHWSLPRFSPDGRRIAVGRWRTGGDYQIVVLDTRGRTLIEVTRGAGINAAPAWSPDGRWLLFWSDRTGIPNLFAAEIGSMGGGEAGVAPAAQAPLVPLQPRLRQVTNVLTGVYHPDVSPDGRWIAYAAYGADGFRIERMPFDTTQWRTPMPAHFAALAEARGEYVQPVGATDLAGAVQEAVALADTTAGPASPYRALRHVRPYGWLPTVESGGYHDTFFGVWMYGSDLVNRHDWELALSVHPGSGQTQGNAAYAFNGLPAMRALGVHPSLGLAVNRRWDLIRPAADRFIDEREDRAEFALALSRQRVRYAASVSFASELVTRSRHLHGAGYPPGSALLNPRDELYGARAVTSFSRYTAPPFAISRENGVVLQLAGRQRWDFDPRTVTTQQGTFTFDGGYRELTTWNAGYLALPLPGFANHVLAGRFSGLHREGAGAGTSGIGGISGTRLGVGVPGVGDFGGTARLLPVRGFSENQRWGTRAWTASAEYRLPLAMPARSLRPLPAFFDRLSGAAFIDAGHAWCDAASATRLGTACPWTDAGAAPLVGAGAEATALLSVYDIFLPVRAGAAVPLQGADRPRAVAYITASLGF
jgi:hypothetical protein